ncbi:hypothetical protein I317_07956 [Kwoniella heveanensis CBS 569]|nr:hypothetical protein I317_07956 [Kwoniella heveanensis CBS 569]
MGGRRCLLPSASKRLRKSAAAGAGAEGSQAGAQDGVIGSGIAGLDARKATNNTSLEAEVDEWDKPKAGFASTSWEETMLKWSHMHLYKGSNLTIIGPDSRRNRENAKNREDRD